MRSGGFDMVYCLVPKQEIDLCLYIENSFSYIFKNGFKL